MGREVTERGLPRNSTHCPPRTDLAPYHLQAHYYSSGPMGYGMGKVEIVQHDGKGHLTFEERPFLVMTDHAFVDLGDYGGK